VQHWLDERRRPARGHSGDDEQPWYLVDQNSIDLYERRLRARPALAERRAKLGERGAFRMDYGGSRRIVTTSVSPSSSRQRQMLVAASSGACWAQPASSNRTGQLRGCRT